jgi:CubicO group peptidase (beta-lactamase class C family)
LCGILSALLYAAMNVLIPLRWPGYDLAAQTISELSAIGAPTRPLWVVLGTIYTALVVVYGLGVWRAAHGTRSLRVAGVALMVSGTIGLVWPPMHLRGAPTTLTDTLHVVWTIATLLLMLVTIGSGAAAFGTRFRRYSGGTIVTFLVFGILTFRDAPALAANLPTPWMGVWERINAAAYQLWAIVFAVALLRRHSVRRVTARATPQVHGTVAPGFEAVRAEFARNFAERGEIGAAVAAYWRGEKVVDLWGGRRSPDSNEPWNADTMVVVMSATKGLAAMTLAVANARGWLDYDASVARYWPEFAQHGKAEITVRQLISHEAGLVLLDEPLTTQRLRDLDYVARVLARQTPAWAPGTRHGYHTITLGLYMQELIRRVDPEHRTLGRFFHEEIAVPLGLDFYIGLPEGIPGERLAKVRPLSPWRGLLALRYTPLAMTWKMLQPGSLLRRSFVGLGADPNDRAYLAVEVPSGNGVGTARAIARAYSAFAEGGSELGITPQTYARVVAPPQVSSTKDAVLGVPSCFSLGFSRPEPAFAFGSTAHAFGSPGAGGSFAFADPDARLGYAYVMNKLDFHLVNDPREKALRDALYRAIARRWTPALQTPRAEPRAVKAGWHELQGHFTDQGHLPR